MLKYDLVKNNHKSIHILGKENGCSKVSSGHPLRTKTVYKWPVTTAVGKVLFFVFWLLSVVASLCMTRQSDSELLISDINSHWTRIVLEGNINQFAAGGNVSPGEVPAVHHQKPHVLRDGFEESESRTHFPCSSSCLSDGAHLKAWSLLFCVLSYALSHEHAGYVCTVFLDAWPRKSNP